MGWKNILLWRVIPGILVVLAAAIGWFASHEVPMGRFFATVVPLMKGALPPTVVGHGWMKGTPPVPDDLVPKPRPKNEIFLKLPGGGKFPQNGLGMCCRATAYDDVLAYRTVLWYLLLGGRHIDGAHLYLNHNAIGKAIKEAVRRGVKRSEIFVTTKIAPSHYGYERAIATVQNFLSEEELGLDYIDLVIMHAPSFPLSTPCKREGKDAAQCRKETWLALSDLRKKGVIKNAGVSNFGVKHLQELENIGAPVANNQIEYNPFVPEYIEETFDYCRKFKIAITAYFPLGGDIANKDKAMRNKILAKISDKHGKSVSQVMLRWAIQRGCAVIPGTGNPKHMEENLEVYAFKLDEEDMKTINGLKHGVTGTTHMDYREFD
eukprot:CAMPEP_0172553752 /NCGR_PEP_ID=MMETSP1067-20121228/51537_1 /TAXON_ID=265564 ORGANISM="Thalassiosira punctigera, Strain Tpunct2005C2" /NCGR_SAMPLE_ID=MMETSP1067 /ASSEMBLY_ACC=CAM_ASM_000444 /LENGTH=376 /DNA_ID=CAMNT_0013341979 /DNA_START=68 /DNA_END=1198 /DNA_ORIENTATION=+